MKTELLKKALWADLRIWERVELIILALVAICIPISWAWATKAIILLLVVSVCKMISSRHVGNRALDRISKSAILLVICYFAIYLISLSYSQNLSEGWKCIEKKLPFLLVPLVFLCSDLSYLRKNHLRAILYLFNISLTIRFIIRFILMSVKVITETHTIKSFFGVFDTVHHAYLAMYTLMAIAFIYTELISIGKDAKRWPIWLLITDMAIMVAYTMFIQSRAGVLCMVLLFAGMLGHLFFIQKKKKLAVIITLVMLVGGAGYMLVTNSLKSGNRLSNTMKEVSSGDHSDVRFEIWSNAAETISENLPWGVGAGDRFDVLKANYPDSTSGSKLKESHVYNPHNQYLDTTLSTGIPGILILLSILVLPLYKKIRNKGTKIYSQYLIPLIFIIALSAPFESIFERQMGVIFFCYFYCLFHVREEA